MIWEGAIDRTEFWFDVRQDVLIAGYHGTDQASVTRSKTNGFSPSQKPRDWLGHGVYFWTDHHLAWYWARKYYGKSAAVLRATLLLGYCVDLDNVDRFANVIRNTLKRLQSESIRNLGGMPQHQGDEHCLDCLVLNHVCKSTVPEVDSLMMTFSRGTPVCDGTQLRDQTHKQICVSHCPECVHEGRP